MHTVPKLPVNQSNVSNSILCVCVHFSSLTNSLDSHEYVDCGNMQYFHIPFSTFFLLSFMHTVSRLFSTQTTSNIFSWGKTIILNCFFCLCSRWISSFVQQYEFLVCFSHPKIHHHSKCIVYNMKSVQKKKEKRGIPWILFTILNTFIISLNQVTLLCWLPFQPFPSQSSCANSSSQSVICRFVVFRLLFTETMTWNLKSSVYTICICIFYVKYVSLFEHIFMPISSFLNLIYFHGNGKIHGREADIFI